VNSVRGSAGLNTEWLFIIKSVIRLIADGDAKGWRRHEDT
jgi:hypothetical protein